MGHSTDTCYANGNRDKPNKKDYTKFPPKGQLAGLEIGNEGIKQVEMGVREVEQQKEMGKQLGEGSLDVGVLPAGVGNSNNRQVSVTGSFDALEVDESSFQTSWSKRGRYGRNRGRGFGRSYSFDRGRGGGSSSRREDVEGSVGYVEKVYGGSSSPVRKVVAMEDELCCGALSNPKYFKTLPNGDFDTEQYEDENDWEPEEEHEGGEKDKQIIIAEKREANVDIDRELEDDSVQKKGRFDLSEDLQMC